MTFAEHISNVSHSPGVYMMLDSHSSVLYVGKAKDLSKRLVSYTRISVTAHCKTSVMLKLVDKVDTIITRTEKEALILEASLIKKHKPKYNIILRDDKNYPLIKVTGQEEWPRVFMTRRRKKDGAHYYGPYSSSSSMWATLKILGSLFPLRRCKGSALKPRKRPCLNYQMGKCMAPCMGKANREQYLENVKNIKMVLEGKNTSLITRLQKKMEVQAQAFAFEKAAETRDKITSLRRTLEKQVVVTTHSDDIDIFGYCRNDTAVSIVILFLRGGMVTGSQSFFITDPFGDDHAVLTQVLNQYYFQGTNLPKKILVPLRVNDHNLLTEHFSDIYGAKVTITIPQRGDKTQLIAMANENAQKVFNENEIRERSWMELAALLQNKLKLQNLPHSVECLDISNLSGKQAVGSLVHFYKGEAITSQYRHYRIHNVQGPDDYAMMEEVLTRRLSKDRESFPDLFMVDGGRGQLGVAMRVVKEAGLEGAMDWVGIAKEKEKEGEKLYKPGRINPILLPGHNPALLYLMRIRDESHRFGVTFHRKLRKKQTFQSELDSIPGIGPARKKQLLKEIGSLTKLKNSSEKTIASIKGVGPQLAKTIYTHLHPQN